MAGFLTTVALVAFLLVAVFPTRTYMAQRAAAHTATRQLDDLQGRNGKLDKQIARLHLPEEIERIARKDYGLVKPGEEAYAILPAPPPRVELPDTWPFTGVADALNR